MDSNSILVFFQGHEAYIKKNTYFTKFIEDIQRNFHIDNKNMNEYQILAAVEFNDGKTRDYPINNDSNYRNIILGNYCVNYIQIKNRKETPKNTFTNKNSNSSINNNSNKKKNYNENSSSKESSNNKMNIEKEINNLKIGLDEVKKDIKTLFEIVKEIQININYIMNNRNSTTSASSTPSNSNSSKRVNNNFNNNFNNNINNNYNNNNINNNYNNNYNNNINNINENSNSSKGISKSNIYNKNIKNPNNNSEFNINKNQNINVYNSVLPNKNVNKFTKYKVDFILYKNKFPVIIKSQLNSNNYRNLEIKIKNTGIDLPAKCKIKSINQSFMKIEPTFINNGRPIKNNELISVILNIKFEMIKNIKQGNYDIQICLFNEYDKEVFIICEEKITVKIIDSETNIVTNKYNNNNNNYNNYLINDEVSSYNLFGNKNLNYLNNVNKNYGNYNNNSNKNVNSSYKTSNNNVYMNNKRSNY